MNVKRGTNEMVASYDKILTRFIHCNVWMGTKHLLLRANNLMS